MLRSFGKEVSTISQEEITILASGPLTSEALSQEVQRVTGNQHLFFYDAISPIITSDSIDFQKAFKASRYGKGGNDYVNCPLDEVEYYRFVDALNQAERIPIRSFERRYLFEGCLPVEEMAERGKETLAYGPLKPVGLVDPRTGKQPFAVVQLRQEDRFETLFNLVGFQTRLKQEEQRKVFQMIPGLERAEFVRWGSVHRNTFIDSPRLLNESLQLRHLPHLFFAGQITGVEGYMESTAMGLLSGINAYRYSQEDTFDHPTSDNSDRELDQLYHPFPSHSFPAYEHQFWTVSSHRREENRPGEEATLGGEGIRRDHAMEKEDGHIIGISRFEARNPNVIKECQMSKFKTQMKS